MEAWKFFQAIRPPDMNCNYIGSARLPVRLLVLTQKMVSGHVILTNRGFSTTSDYRRQFLP